LGLDDRAIESQPLKSDGTVTDIKGQEEDKRHLKLRKTEGRFVS
jgi:hypothetical protein